jgi:hypothetical protein
MKVQSTILSEEPVIKEGKVTLPIVKVGTSAFDEAGQKYKFNNGKALESYREYAFAIIKHLRIGSGRITGMYTFSDTGED